MAFPRAQHWARITRPVEPAWIIGGARTPFAVWAGGKRSDGSPGGALKEFDPFDLGAAALKGALARSKTSSKDVKLVVFANMYHAGSHACYGARYVSLRSDFPEDIPSLTVSMACASGLWALISAVQNIQLGAAELVGVGGTDVVSRVRRDVVIPSFTDVACGKAIGLTVEDLAKEYGISRKEQDRWALRSHTLARRAQEEGRLSEEIVEAGGIREDDAIRPDAGLDFFEAFPPLFGENGGVTKANTHGLVDGASALILSAKPAVSASGSRPLGRFVGGAFSATAPDRMGYASVPAIRKVLNETCLKIKDIDLFEINETFAAQTLIDIKELGIPEEKVNVNGGAIALGHPFAGTGCRQVLALLLELKRRGLRRGVASICAGGGLGAAVLVERV